MDTRRSPARGVGAACRRWARCDTTYNSVPDIYLNAREKPEAEAFPYALLQVVIKKNISLLKKLKKRTTKRGKAKSHFVFFFRLAKYWMRELSAEPSCSAVVKKGGDAEAAQPSSRQARVCENKGFVVFVYFFSWGQRWPRAQDAFLIFDSVLCLFLFVRRDIRRASNDARAA